MRDFLKEPLFHFLLAGVALFALFEALSPVASYDAREIVVNEESLLTYIQYRSRAFEPELARARLRSMPEADLERLIEDFVREEALYREAISLGLEENDYIIKRRLVQSIEFITTGFATAGTKVSEDDVRAYYQANRERYFVEPFATFTHVFFSSEKRGRAEALAQANRKLEELNRDAVPFEGAVQHGDYFAYSTNYVEREPAYIAGQFGRPFTEALFALKPDAQQWLGPIESPFGFHLVLLTEQTEGRYPMLDEVEEGVRYDAEQDAIKAMNDRVVAGIVETYTVRRELGSDGGAGDL